MPISINNVVFQKDTNLFIFVINKIKVCKNGFLNTVNILVQIRTCTCSDIQFTKKLTCIKISNIDQE